MYRDARLVKDAECEPHEGNKMHMVEDPSRGTIDFALNFKKRNWGLFPGRNGNGETRECEQSDEFEGWLSPPARAAVTCVFFWLGWEAKGE